MIDIRDRLLAAFEAERQDHLEQMRLQLARVRAGGRADVRELFRRAHSLKGAARAVDLVAIEQEAHALEELLEGIEAGRLDLDAAAVRRIEGALDRIETGPGTDAEGAAPDALAPAAVVRVQHERVRALAQAAAQLADLAAASDASETIDDIAEDLIRTVDEANASGDPALAQGLARQSRTLKAIARRLREAEAGVERALGQVEAETRALLLAPAGEMLAGFDRMVRELAESAGKRARLIVAGAEVEADRRILEALRDPILHLLRNAVAHGIEAPAMRLRAGKPAEAEVRIDFVLDRDDLVVSVCDDGRGLDRVAVATATGGRADEPDDVLFGRLFTQGVSTATGVDRVAGRGVGLAVVADAARALGGSTRIAPAEPGPGTCATLHVPRAAIRQMVVKVVAGGGRFALPARAIGRLVRLAGEDIGAGEGGPVASVAGNDTPLPVVDLARLLLLEEGARVPHAPALLLVSGADRLLVLVDELQRAEPVLIHPAGDIALAPALLAGAVVEPGGGVLPVLDPAALVALARTRGGLRAAAEAAPEAAPGTILVVDDSITTRTLQRSLLEGQGYRVELAVDGVAALQLLRDRAGAIDLALVDVEMPRLDGFGLLDAMRNDPALANIPVVMMTSRNSPEDVRRGLEHGANAYLTKQAFDAGELLAAVARFV